MGYYINNDLANFRRGKDKQKRKSRTILGTAAKVAGSGALLAAGTRYGGAALLKRSKTANNLVSGALKRGYDAGENLIKSDNSIMRGLGNQLQKRTTLAKIGLMVNQGARGTLKSDVSKIAKRAGIKIKKKDNV